MSTSSTWTIKLSTSAAAVRRTCGNSYAEIWTARDLLSLRPELMTIHAVNGRLPGLCAENWRPAIGFEGLYEVSDLGRVRSIARSVPRIDGRFYRVKSRVLKPARRVAGYLHVVIRKDNKPYTRTVHRLVMEAFVGPRPYGMECCHCNGIPHDNRLENLRWDTPLSNGVDRKFHGTANQGFRNPNAFLTAEQIELIRSATGSDRQVGKRFGVAPETARRIRKRLRWAHVGAA